MLLWGKVVPLPPPPPLLLPETTWDLMKPLIVCCWGLAKFSWKPGFQEHFSMSVTQTFTGASGGFGGGGFVYVYISVTYIHWISSDSQVTGLHLHLLNKGSRYFNKPVKGQKNLTYTLEYKIYFYFVYKGNKKCFTFIFYSMAVPLPIPPINGQIIFLKPFFYFVAI